MSFPGAARRFHQDSYCVHGVSFSFRTNHFEARDSFSRLYHHFPETSAGGILFEVLLESNRGGFHWRAGGRGGTQPRLDRALLELESVLCESIIRSQPRRIAVHAATLYADDSAVLLVGASNTGKSTLSMALSRRGLVTGTDDVVLVDPETLDLFPIPRCFHLDDRSVGLLEGDGLPFPAVWKRLPFLTPFDFDQRPFPGCRAGLLVYVTPSRGESPVLQPISQSEMAARLLSETGQGPLADPETVGVLSRVSGSACGYTLCPGPLGQTADAILELIHRHGTNRPSENRSAGLSNSRRTWAMGGR